MFFQKAADDCAGQIVRTRSAQRAARRFADGGAETIDDDGFLHVHSQSACSRARLSYAAQFLNGFPVFSMCCMRSWVLRCPHRLRNASLSKSSKYCSETV